MRQTRIRFTFAVLLTYIAIICLLIPSITDTLNKYHAAKDIVSYSEEVIHENDIEEKIKEAEKYNEELYEYSKTNGNQFLLKNSNYFEILDLKNSIIGYVDIPKINVKLPIKHGTEDDVLENCIGHIERTSFPIGGVDTHTVLSGHRALATAKLFTDIDKLVTGDIFYITVVNKKLAYEVDNIQTVLPSEVNALKIQDGKDLATLVTCTPYGINTHRLLVTGHRVDLTAAPKENYTDPMRDVIKPALIESGIVIVMTFACIITIVLIWKKGRRNE